MQRTQSAGRLRKLITSMRQAHARDSAEWSRRMEGWVQQHPSRRS